MLGYVHTLIRQCMWPVITAVSKNEGLLKVTAVTYTVNMIMSQKRYSNSSIEKLFL